MKIILRLPAILLIIFLFVRCEKPGNTVEDTKTPTLIVNANPSAIEYGSSTMISIMATNTDSVTSDLPGASNIVGDFTKSVATPVLTATATYHFKAYGGNGKVVVKNITISVSPKPGKPTLSTSFTFNEQVVDTLPYFGGPVKIKVVFANGVLYLNGVRYENSPAAFDFTVTETKTFDFVVIGPGGETLGSITIPVKVPGVYESLFTGGNSRKWEIYDYEWSYEIDANYTHFNGPSGVVWTFYLLPQKMYDQDQSSFNWSMNGDTIIGFGDRKVLSYTETEMVLRYQTGEIGSDRHVWVKEYLRIINEY